MKLFISFFLIMEYDIAEFMVIIFSDRRHVVVWLLNSYMGVFVTKK